MIRSTRAHAVLLLATTAALLPSAVPAGASELDPSFAAAGKLGAHGNAGIVAAPDGGLWTADFTFDDPRDPTAGGKLDIERRRPDGSIDLTWDGDGDVHLTALMSGAEPYGTFRSSSSSISPNAVGGVDVLYVASTPTPRARLLRLTGTGSPDPAFNGGLPLDLGGASAVVPDGDGVAVATAGKAAGGADATVLTRFGPDGTPRAGWPQTIGELGSRTPSFLARRADGSFVIAAIDPALIASPLARTSDDYRLAARSASGGPVPGYTLPAAVSILPFGGLAATTSGRLLISGTTNAGVRPIVEGRDPSSGVLDPGFGTDGLLTLQPPSFFPSSARAMTAVGSSAVISVINGDDDSQGLIVVNEDGTVRDGPQVVPGSAGRPIWSGIAPVVTADRSRVYVVVGDAGNPTVPPGPGEPPPTFIANVVALKGTNLPPVPPPPPVTPPTTPSPTPTPTAPVAPTPPAPTPPAAPKVTVTVKKLVAAKGGTATLTIRTSARGDLLLSASAKSGRKTLRWGPVAATLRAAGTRTVTLRPSAAVRRALAKRGSKLSAALTVRFLPASGAAVQVKRTVTLRGARR